MDGEQRAFLESRKWAVLATGRRDGSPQVSTVGYVLDDEGRLLLSVKAFTAKWKNALRQPKVALVVNDDRKQCVVYGAAEGIDADPERAELTGRVFERLSGNLPPEGEAFTKLLDDQQRTVLRITPEKITLTD
jgi:PPOX class probable F420-dependent enzyme